MLPLGRSPHCACLQLRLEEVFFCFELPDFVEHDLVHLHVVRSDFWSGSSTQSSHSNLSLVLVIDLAVEVFAVPLEVVHLLFLLLVDVGFVLVGFVLPDAVLVADVAGELCFALALLFGLLRRGVPASSGSRGAGFCGRLRAAYLCVLSLRGCGL